MNLRIFLAGLLILLMVSVVHGAIINTTTLRGDVADYTHLRENTFGDETVVSAGTGIVEETIGVWADNAPVSFTAQFNDGTSVSGSVEKVPYNLFTGNLVVKMGATTFTRSYSRPLNAVSPKVTIYMIYVTDGSTWYLCAVPRDKVIDNTNIMNPDGPLWSLFANHGIYGYVHLDNPGDAYVVVSSPDTNQIIDFGIDSSSPFDVQSTVALLSNVAIYAPVAKAHALSGATASWTDQATTLLNYITTTYNSLASLSLASSSFTLLMMAWGAVIFSGAVIIGFSAVYIAIALILAVEDADDIFKAFGNFERRVRYLFRTYMEVFNAIKAIIKWW